MSGPVEVFTLGHSTRSVDEVVAMLRANGITDLVDVRSYPSSRTFPQWGQEALRDALPDDIAYHWLPRLGGRRHTPAGTPSPNGGWRVKAFSHYADYMATDEFAEGLAELTDLARRGRVAIMCSEAVPWRCHRRLITDALLCDGVAVHHIMSATSTRPAEPTPFLRIDDDSTLTYPAPEAADGHPAGADDRGSGRE
ncbi:DUF488 family protein [Gordonia sp. (in: high G+C Gram-positive bacteria)]|uniref:DUF488 domain-containing protein n=1 Tax=Gordonia sp. (in: high G+C Gram-positive bacteria) TaxID=84139 RepID=UPI0035285373